MIMPISSPKREAFVYTAVTSLVEGNVAVETLDECDIQVNISCSIESSLGTNNILMNDFVYKSYD